MHSVEPPHPFAAALMYTMFPADARLTCDAIMLPAVVERAPERHPCSATGTETACLTVVQENVMQEHRNHAGCSSKGQQVPLHQQQQCSTQASLGLRSTPLHPAHHNNRFGSVLKDGLDAVQEVRVWGHACNQQDCRWCSYWMHFQGHCDWPKLMALDVGKSATIS